MHIHTYLSLSLSLSIYIYIYIYTCNSTHVCYYDHDMALSHRTITYMSD